MAQIASDPPAASGPTGDRPPYALLVSLFLGSRAFVWLAAAIGLWRTPLAAGFTRPTSVLDWFARWDATYYLDIASNGYRWAPGAATNVGFFPLLPWLMRVGSLNGLLDVRLVGYVIASIALWGACVLLWKLVAEQWTDPRLATSAVVFLLFNPVSFFFSAIYSESLFLLWTIACFAAIRRDRWAVAGAFAALAALTRYVGLVLVVPLAWEWLMVCKERGHGGPRVAAMRLLACLGPVAGYAVYCAVMWAKFGNPFMYSVAGEASGRHFTWFWGLFARPSFLGLPLFYQVWFAGTLIVAFALMVGGVVLRLGTTYAIYALAFALVYISARFVDSLPRYFTGVFPLYIAVALIVRRWPLLRVPLLASCIALGVLSVVLFVNGYWFT
jgi:hypothetical protein